MNDHKSGSFMKAGVTLSQTPPQHDPTNAVNSSKGQVTWYILNDYFVTFSYEPVDGLGTR